MIILSYTSYLARCVLSELKCELHPGKRLHSANEDGSCLKEVIQPETLTRKTTTWVIRSNS